VIWGVIWGVIFGEILVVIWAGDLNFNSQFKNPLIPN
jgi:hypothetical protein